MRTFVQLRELAATHKELAIKPTELERKVAGHDGHIQSLFEAIPQLMNQPASPGRRIGFDVKSLRQTERASQMNRSLQVV